MRKRLEGTSLSRIEQQVSVSFRQTNKVSSSWHKLHFLLCSPLCSYLSCQSAVGDVSQISELWDQDKSKDQNLQGTTDVAGRSSSSSSCSSSCSSFFSGEPVVFCVTFVAVLVYSKEDAANLDASLHRVRKELKSMIR